MDPAVKLLLEHGDEVTDITPEEFERVRKKIDWHLLPLLFLLYMIQFADKVSLGSSAVLGLRTDTHLNATQYNMLGTVFYIGYLAFVWPQNILLQRFPVARVLTTNIFIWALSLTLHSACKNFGGLLVLRLMLGACEGCVTAGFLITTSQFYLKSEQAQRVGWWFLFNGTAQCFIGLMAYGVLHIHAGGWMPWRWFCIILGLLTFITATLFLFFFPSNPATARFLTTREKVVAIKRIAENQTGTENKQWKMYQFVEALKEPVIWIFFLFSFLDNIPNSLTNQSSIIINSMGFTVLQTTLLGIPSGVIEILTILSGVTIIRYFKNGRAFVSVVYFIPNIVGCCLLLALPESNQTGRLISLYVTGVGTTGFVIALGWCSTAVAGHTKKTTFNAINLIGYCLGNIVGPLMWLEKYKPMNKVPWSVITACYTICPMLLLCIRFILQRENARRDALQSSQPSTATTAEEVVLKLDGGRADSEKGQITAKIDTAFLDLTDRENINFRYPL
ncbi:MFS general substrate transporter [Violaceomyces palustris]|uniref:MFS general substrate transporter n=1 Tax=Violaceomyces palustris TaxID=1673888 RepID=A0ACD0P050_9BASI|nr:MFS general substrate transporter [Violaceomyces palustris]